MRYNGEGRRAAITLQCEYNRRIIVAQFNYMRIFASSVVVGAHTHTHHAYHYIVILYGVTFCLSLRETRVMEKVLWIYYSCRIYISESASVILVKGGRTVDESKRDAAVH